MHVTLGFFKVFCKIFQGVPDHFITLRSKGQTLAYNNIIKSIIREDKKWKITDFKYLLCPPKSQARNIFYAFRKQRLQISTMPFKITGYKYLLCPAKPQATNICYALIDHRLQVSTMPSKITGYKYLLCLQKSRNCYNKFNVTKFACSWLAHLLKNELHHKYHKDFCLALKAAFFHN